MRSNILAWVLGVWLLQQQAVLPGMAWAAVMLLIAAPVFLLRNTLRPFSIFARRICIMLLWLGAGFFWAALLAQQRLADDLPQQWEGADVEITGVVAALPQQGERALRFEFDVENVLTPHAIIPRHLQLSWFTRGFGEQHAAQPPARFHAGERWQLTVRLKRPHGNANPYGFDYEAWLLERNIRATGNIRPGADNRRLEKLVVRPSYLIEYLREAIAQRLDRVLQDRPYAGVLKALAIGDQGAIPQAQWQVFLRTGVNHLMSISGLHVTMLASMAFAFTYWLWRRSSRLTQRFPARKAAVLAGVAAALSYALLSGFAVPAQRTVYMLAAVALALWTGRISSTSLILCLALLAVTLLDPWAVLAPGFWLSFGAVAVLLYVGAGRIGKPHWLREAINTQWAVTLGLIPALLVLFQQVSIISPLANAFAIPLISLVVTPLTLAGAFLPLDFLLRIAHELTAWCMLLLTFLSSLPDAVWQQHAPPAWTALIALLGIGWLFLPRGFPVRWLGLVALLPMFMLLPPAPERGALWLTVLDVGQGLAVVAQTREHALLYDTGPRFGAEADSGNRVILPYLRGAGVKHLDGVIVTHNDADHSGGAISVLDGIPVSWLVSSLPADSPILAHSSHSLPCYAGQSWVWDGVRFDMLHPMQASYLDDNLKDNARGCVLKITSAYGSVLLPADIERESESELLERQLGMLPATVLLAPHHGSKTSSTQEFISQVNPSVVIYTVGYRNRFGHPKAEIVERYRALGSRAFRSDENGAVELHFDGNTSANPRPYRQTERRYWRD